MAVMSANKWAHLHVDEISTRHQVPTKSGIHFDRERPSLWRLPQIKKI